MTQMIECVPNFSEARNPGVIQIITQNLTAIPGITLANQHSDLDHNRSVLTIFGEIQAIAEAGFLCAKLASEHIDLEKHTGQHPRIGALDVLPFIPVREATMQDCVMLAHSVGKRIGTELGIPVYYYGEAALRPERRALENIRRGEYEQLKTQISADHQKTPDEGPAMVGSAGAVAIGARKPLIAFNVFLKTQDEAVAQKIAKKIRFSSGGFPADKALGLSVGGLAQVSMNFSDYTLTNLPAVLHGIQQEAERLGTEISHSELVGLLPQDAALKALADCLRLPALEPDQLIEHYL
jgi:glutamate formiminotransferase